MTLSAEATNAIEKFIVGAPYGQLLGLTCERIEPDRVCVRLPYREALTTLGEMVHGGAIASLVDVAATAAAWAHPEASFGARGTTVGFNVNYLAPGLGCDLVADARIVKRGGSLCVIDVAVASPEETPVARALVTYKLSLARSADA